MKAFYTIKKFLLYRRKMGYFPKGLTHDWSRNDDWGRSREKRRLSRLQKYLFHIVKKSVITQDFRQKFELSSLLVFIENRPNNDIWGCFR